MALDKKNNIQYKLNPNLPILKKGWKGNILLNGEFHNNNNRDKPPLLDVIKWKLSKNPQRKEKKLDTFKLESSPFKNISKSENNIIWLGHSSFIITINGITLITDPSLFNASIVKREVALPCDLDSLTGIDYLLISHDHRDHFDEKSVETIVKNNPNIIAFIPLGGKRIFKTTKQKSIEKQEAGWYQEYNVKDDIRIVFLPAQHWGRRGPFDFNQTLWGSFLIISGDTKIFFSGDTAYNDRIFKDIQSEFGAIDICILPIGAYAPSFIMKPSHTTPEEAVTIFDDLKGNMFIPMHYGTYDLSDEPLGEPIRRLEKCFDNKNSNQLNVLTVGKAFDF